MTIVEKFTSARLHDQPFTDQCVLCCCFCANGISIRGFVLLRATLVLWHGQMFFQVEAKLILSTFDFPGSASATQSCAMETVLPAKWAEWLKKWTRNGFQMARILTFVWGTLASPIFTLEKNHFAYFSRIFGVISISRATSVHFAPLRTPMYREVILN